MAKGEMGPGGPCRRGHARGHSGGKLQIPWKVSAIKQCSRLALDQLRILYSIYRSYLEMICFRIKRHILRIEARYLLFLFLFSLSFFFFFLSQDIFYCFQMRALQVLKAIKDRFFSFEQQYTLLHS